MFDTTNCMRKVDVNSDRLCRYNMRMFPYERFKEWFFVRLVCATPQYRCYACITPAYKASYERSQMAQHSNHCRLMFIFHFLYLFALDAALLKPYQFVLDILMTFIIGHPECSGAFFFFFGALKMYFSGLLIFMQSHSLR